MISESRNLEKILITIAGLSGGLILFFPIQYLIFALIGLIILLILLLNPKVCFYLSVFSMPLAQIELFRIAGHMVNPYNLILHICMAAIFLNFLTKKNLDLSTKLDKWFIVLSLFFIFAGLNSPDSSAGMSIVTRYLKAIVLFYMTVYMFRTKQIKLSTTLKIMLTSALIQVFLVICPNINQYFVHETLSPRGYLGLIGIGPLLVHQAKGTFAMFSDFGYYLDVIIFLMFPMFRSIYKNKLLGNIIIAFLFLGVFVSYSRGALFAFILSYFYYTFLIAEDKIIFIKERLWLIISSIFLGLGFVFKTAFVNTLNPRDDIWEIHLSYMKDHIDKLWLGNGLGSFFSVFPMYLPGNVPLKKLGMFYPHNYYIFLIEELGIFGGILFICFWIYLFIDSFKKTFKNKLIPKNLNVSLNITILILFLAGMYDQSFYHPHLFMVVIFILAVVYSKGDVKFVSKEC